MGIPSLPRAPVPMSEADVVAALFDKLQEIGPEPEALPICDKILEQCPADPDVLRCKCVCLVHDNRFEEALTFIDSCGAGAALVFERAYCLYKCKRYEECLKIAKLPEHSANDHSASCKPRFSTAVGSTQKLQRFSKLW